MRAILTTLLLSGLCVLARDYASSTAGNNAQLPLHLSDVHAADYRVLSHPAYPAHAVRIQRAQDFCDTSVRAYTGYVDIGARHLFFYFFESRRQPEADDVVMWINGGATAAIGMLMELGPCAIAANNKTTHNPFSWTNTANMLFLDQPAGTGLSYAEHGESVTTTEDAAKDAAAFFAILSHALPQFRGRALHLAGESYAGHMLPVFAAEIVDQNKRLKEMGMQQVNLTSVIIGNGLVNLYHTITSSYDMQCTNASGLGIIQTASACTRMRRALPRCQMALRRSCQETLDYMGCEAAFKLCESVVVTPFLSLGLNPYDVSKRCSFEKNEATCYLETTLIEAYLNAPATRAALRTDQLPEHVSLVAPAVQKSFWASGDWFRPSQLRLGPLLDLGIRVLIYAGANDVESSWVGLERAVVDIEWAEQRRWARTERKEWVVDGEVAGVARELGQLSFVRVDGAGHFAPHDKPKTTLEMLARWLQGRTIAESRVG